MEPRTCLSSRTGQLRSASPETNWLDQASLLTMASRSNSIWAQLALLAALMTACSSQASQPQANASAVATPTSTLAACRLPVVSWYQPGNPVQLPSFGVQAHYVSYPDGAISTGAADAFTRVEDGF